MRLQEVLDEIDMLELINEGLQTAIDSLVSSTIKPEDSTGLPNTPSYRVNRESDGGATLFLKSAKGQWYWIVKTVSGNPSKAIQLNMAKPIWDRKIRNKIIFPILTNIMSKAKFPSQFSDAGGSNIMIGPKKTGGGQLAIIDLTKSTPLGVKPADNNPTTFDDEAPQEEVNNIASKKEQISKEMNTGTPQKDDGGFGASKNKSSGGFG